jgi:hypothetical protein
VLNEGGGGGDDENEDENEDVADGNSNENVAKRAKVQSIAPDVLQRLFRRRYFLLAEPQCGKVRRCVFATPVLSTFIFACDNRRERFSGCSSC